MILETPKTPVSSTAGESSLQLQVKEILACWREQQEENRKQNARIEKLDKRIETQQAHIEKQDKTIETQQAYISQLAADLHVNRAESDRLGELRQNLHLRDCYKVLKASSSDDRPACVFTDPASYYQAPLAWGSVLLG
jgi:predicted RNase H-like nuclease (RuvC/YqgF family)